AGASIFGKDPSFSRKLETFRDGIDKLASRAPRYRRVVVDLYSVRSVLKEIYKYTSHTGKSWPVVRIVIKLASGFINHVSSTNRAEAVFFRCARPATTVRYDWGIRSDEHTSQPQPRRDLA